MSLSNDSLVAFHYKSYGTFCIHSKRLHNLHGGFTHYRNYRADIADYDTVIFGHPIWWGIPPRILYTVIEDLELTGKKVASFATSGVSSFGQAQLDMDWLLDRPLRGRILSNEASISSWLTGNQLKKRFHR